MNVDVRNLMKKAICITIIAALVVCFAFALVACNKEVRAVDMTDADFTELRGYMDTSTSAHKSFGAEITVVTEVEGGTETEEKSVGIYTNGTNDSTVVIDSTVTAADGTVNREYAMAGVISYTQYAVASFENGELVASNFYEKEINGKEIKISNVVNESGCFTAVETLRKALDNYDHTSATVKKIADGDRDYVIAFEDDATAATATISVTVRGGTITEIKITTEGMTSTTAYTYDLGSLKPLSLTDWYQEYPKP